MALRTRRVKRVFAYEKTNTEKYVLVPDRATTVTFENLCSVAARSTTLSLESSPTCDKRPSLRNENLHPRGPSRADRGHRHIHALVQRKKPAGRGRGVEADELCLRQSSRANIILYSKWQYEALMLSHSDVSTNPKSVAKRGSESDYALRLF